MKSYTRNPPNIPSQRADKRFDELVKKEMMEHQHLISSHNKEMQALRELLSLASEKFESLWGKSEQDLKDFKTYTVCNLGVLKEKISGQEITISQQKMTIEDLHKQLQDFHVIYSSKEESDKFKRDLDSTIKDSTMRCLDSIQELQREFKSLIKDIQSEVTKSKYESENKFNELEYRIGINFNLTTIDREGVLKEVRIWEKNIFIIEKKIENIYTLIERINKRGETCHKLE